MIVKEYGGLKVTKDICNNEGIRRLKKGDVVEVTGIQASENAVLGRIEDGWITLVDTFYNYRFAKLTSSESDVTKL